MAVCKVLTTQKLNPGSLNNSLSWGFVLQVTAAVPISPPDQIPTNLVVAWPDFLNLDLKLVETHATGLFKSQRKSVASVSGVNLFFLFFF